MFSVCRQSQRQMRPIAKRATRSGRKGSPWKHCAGIRAAVGGSAWTSLYQQRPTAEEGAIFQRTWWRRYTELPPKFTKIVLSLDTAFKTGRSNDFSVGTVWGVTDNALYLLDRWSGRVEFPELKRKVAAMALEWRPNAILIEDKASGQSLIQELQASTRFPVLPVQC